MHRHLDKQYGIIILCEFWVLREPRFKAPSAPRSGAPSVLSLMTHPLFIKMKEGSKGNVVPLK
jgi:hypothetical protein